MIEFPPYRMDRRAGCLWRGNAQVALRPKAWALLRYLAERPGALVSKEELLAAVWGAAVSDDTLTSTVAELRRALGDRARTPSVIETVHGRGLRFIAKLGASRPDAVVPVRTSEPEVAILVGRDAELERLRAVFRLAEDGRRQIVFLEGEPGIGKSAIVDAFLREVQASAAPIQVGYGQCVEQGGEREAYMPALEALERLSRGPTGPRVMSALRSVAPSWLAELPSIERPVDAKRRQRWQADVTPKRMLREFASLVETLSSSAPLVLILEDLHWSDQGTLDLLSVLAQRPERARALVLATFRPAQAVALEHPIRPLLATLRARRACTEIALDYLTRNDVAAYLGHRFGGTPVDPGVVEAIHARTDGHPLFMTVLVDHLIARGWLAELVGAWRLTAARTRIEQDVPDNVRQLIEGQLRFVSPAERAVLEVASVGGVAFDAPAVAAGLGDADHEVESICHRLCRAQLWLRELGSREWPDGALAVRYAFRHALYQRALYDDLAPSRRVTLHERLGKRLEAAFAGRTTEISSELARHFQLARDSQRALAYLEQAATRAHARRAYREVLSCLEAAQRLIADRPDTPDRARDELRLRRLSAAALSDTAGYSAPVTLQEFARMTALSERIGDDAALFEVLSGLFSLHFNNGDRLQRAAIEERLTPLAARLGGFAALQCYFVRGRAALWDGDLVAAESLLAEALASPVSLEEGGRAYGVNPVVGIRSFEGLRRWVIGDPIGARAVQREALVLAEEHGRPFTIAAAAAQSALVLALEEDWAGVQRLATRALELSDEYELARWRATAQLLRGRAQCETGGPQGLAEMRQGREALSDSDVRAASSLRLAIFVGGCLRLGQWDEGLAAADAALAHCRDVGEHLFEAELWRLRGALLLGRARTAAPVRPIAVPEAEECYEKARSVARAQGAHMLERRANLPQSGPASSPGVALPDGLPHAAARARKQPGR